MPSREPLAVRAGRWSTRHRRLAIFGWLGLVLVSVVLGSAIGRNYLADEDLGSGESKQADQTLAKAGFSDRATESVLVQDRDGRLTFASPQFKAVVREVTQTVSRFDTVTEVKSPLDPANSGQIAEDRRSALVQFDIIGDSDQAKDRVAPIETAVAQVQNRHPGFRVEEFGDASADRALSKAFEDDFRKAEVLSLPITLIILIVAFGALVAAGLPLLLGLSAVAITLGVLAPLSQVFPVDEAISSVILLIGLAVGVDYSLFYIRRERDERAAGRGPDAALEAAAATSGRAVLVSGTTVMAAMAGMYITGNATFQSFATGTILVVAVAMVGSVTVLPAMLSWLGDRIDKGRIPFLSRRRRSGPETGMWASIVERVLRHPVIALLAGAAVLIVIALPAFRLHTANSGVQGLPRDLPVMQTYDRIQKAFPGGPLPANIAVVTPNPRSQAFRDAVARLRQRALATGLMQEPITVTPSPRDPHVVMISVPLAGKGTDDPSNDALDRLRNDIIPATLDRVPRTTTAVTGLTAGSKDFNELMKQRAPWVFLFVLSLAFLLLMVTFRSIVIPAKAVVLNLLSVGAAYGVLVWVFQDGHLESLLGFTSIGGITSWLPLFLFVILFGLSMDYHVFILSRVREGHDRGMSTDEAVSHGIKATASVVTSAAVVMVGVFAIFATLSSIDFKQMGIGLSVAVLIDATIVRAVLLPASMKLLGDWNWYLPRWLEWLPRIAQEEPLPAAAGRPDGDRLSVDVERAGEEIRLRLDGDLDLETAPILREQLVRHQTDGETLVVDLTRVGFIDSSGVRELTGADERARSHNARFVIVRGPRAQIAEVLSMTTLDATVETTGSEPGADGPQRGG